MTRLIISVVALCIAAIFMAMDIADLKRKLRDEVDWTERVASNYKEKFDKLCKTHDNFVDFICDGFDDLYEQFNDRIDDINGEFDKVYDVLNIAQETNDEMCDVLEMMCDTDEMVIDRINDIEENLCLVNEELDDMIVELFENTHEEIENIGGSCHKCDEDEDYEYYEETKINRKKKPAKKSKKK